MPSWSEEMYGVNCNDVCGGCKKTFGEHYGMDCSHKEGGPKFQRLPSSQPEKVEPRVGQQWKCDGRWTYKLGGRTEEGKWYSDAHGPDVFLAEFPGPRWTLISTGEAETGSLTGAVVAPAARVEVVVCIDCDMAPVGRPIPMRVTNGRPQPMCDDCYLKREQTIAGLTRPIKPASPVSAPKSEPSYQPHWQRTASISTYARRVPR